MSEETHVIDFLDGAFKSFVDFGGFGKWVFQLHVLEESIHFFLDDVDFAGGEFDAVVEGYPVSEDVGGTVYFGLLEGHLPFEEALEGY